MATHSRVLAWRIQGRGSLVGCTESVGSHRVGRAEETWQQQQQGFG